LLGKEEQQKKEYEGSLKELLESCPLKPLNDRVIVFPERVGAYDKKTDSGIIVIDSVKKNAKKATNKGTVLGVGEGLILATGEKIVPNCSVGDVIMYEQFGYSEVYLNNNLCHVVRAGDILGKADSSQGKRVAGF
jgi:co-chaperonin GroES (HSP10)